MAIIYVLPTFFQASHLASASASGIKILPLVGTLPRSSFLPFRVLTPTLWQAFTIAPSAMVAAVSIELSGTYRLQNWIGWALTLLGLGLFTLLKVWIQSPWVRGATDAV